MALPLALPWRFLWRFFGASLRGREQTLAAIHVALAPQDPDHRARRSTSEKTDKVTAHRHVRHAVKTASRRRARDGREAPRGSPSTRVPVNGPSPRMASAGLVRVIGVCCESNKKAPQAEASEAKSREETPKRRWQSCCHHHRSLGDQAMVNGPGRPLRELAHTGASF